NVERDRSNTPLQALTTLNNDTFVEAAQALATQVLKESGSPTDADRLTGTFRRCTTRPPDEYELQRLTDLLEIHRAHYREHAEDADRRVATAYRLDDVPIAEAAGWTANARIVLNLDEVITRE